MAKQILGMNPNIFYTIVIVLLLIILGLVSFHHYTYLYAKDSLNFGAGFGVSIPANPRIFSGNRSDRVPISQNKNQNQ